MKKQQSPATLGTVAGLGAYTIWGLFPLYFHQLHGIRATEIAGVRVLATTAVVWAVLAFKGDFRWAKEVRSWRICARILLSGLAITSNWLMYVWAVSNNHVVDAAIGYYINPLITVAIGVFVLRERLRTLQKISIALGATAVGVLSFAYGKVPWVALSLAFSFALYAFLKKTIVLESLVSLGAETLAMTPFAIGGLIWISLHGRLDVAKAHTSEMVLLALIGFVTAVPLVLFGFAARRIPLAQIGLLQYLTPTMILLVGVFAFHEKVSNWRWVGMFIVWCALIVLAIDAFSSSRKQVAAFEIATDAGVTHV
jgi:chloramphenicol-sensitive protein RarD